MGLEAIGVSMASWVCPVINDWAAKPTAVTDKRQEVAVGGVFSAISDFCSNIEAYNFEVAIANKTTDYIINLSKIYIEKKNVKVLITIANSLYEKGQFGLARQFYDGIVEHLEKPLLSAEEKVILSDVYIRLGRYKEAIPLLKELTQTADDKELALAAYSYSIDTYFSLMMYEEVVAEATEALSLEPKNLDVKFQLYNSLKQLGERERAEKILDELLIMAKDNNDVSSDKLAHQKLMMARLLIERCNYAEAEKIGLEMMASPSPATAKEALNVLRQIYGQSQNYSELEKLAELVRQKGFDLEYLEIKANLLGHEMTLDENQRSPEKMDALEQERRDCDRMIKAYMADRLLYFPRVDDQLSQILDNLLGSDSLRSADLSRLNELAVEQLPDKATRILTYIRKFELMHYIHYAGATGRPQQFGGLRLEYRSYKDFPGYSAEDGARLPDKETEALLLKDLGELPYYVKQPEVLVGRLEQAKNTDPDLAGKRLEDLTVQEAVILVARATEEIVGKYEESPESEYSCRSIDEKIQKGDYNKAVCRHYTVLYLALFNQLKADNPNLSNYYAISDYAEIHTFPTIFTTSGSKLIFTSLDPTADDLTPKFGDALAASPDKHFQLFDFANQLIGQGKGQAAVAMLSKQLSGWQKYPGQMLKAYNYMYEAYKSDTATTIDDFKKLEESIATYLRHTPKSHETTGLRTQLQLIIAKIKDRLGSKMTALRIVDRLLIRQSAVTSPELFCDLFSLKSSLLSQLKMTGQLKALAGQIRKGNNIMIFARIDGKFLVNPVFEYLNNGGKVVIRIDGQDFEGEIKNGKIALPEVYSNYADNIQGAEYEVIINPKKS